MKTKEKLEARRIRVEKQLAIQDIANRLGVAKSSVSLWVRDLPLLPTTIKKHNMTGCVEAAHRRSNDARIVRSKYQQDGKEMAHNHQDNLLFVSGCMMHWAEGEKDKNIASISNTDLYFLKLWMRFIKRFFSTQTTNFRAKISCYLDNGQTQEQIESYWSEQLSLSRSCFTKTTIIKKHPMSTGAKRNRHPYGIVRITVYSTKIVQQIWGAIKFFANIDNDNKWLN